MSPEYRIEERMLSEQPTAVVRGSVRVDEIGAFLARAYDAVGSYLGQIGVGIAGEPFARYQEDAGEFAVEAGFPVEAPVEGSGDIDASTLPGGRAAVTWHVGPYDAMAPAYAALAEWINRHRAKPTGPAWEVYHTDPYEHPDPATWRTEVVQTFAPQ